jgi:hypothetical protein
MDLSKIDHILGHKASLNKYKKIERTPCILYYQNAIKLELNNKSSSRKCTVNWRLNNTLLNNRWVIEQIMEKIKKFLEFNENEKSNLSEPMGHRKGSPKRKIIAMSTYTKNIERTQISYLMLHLKLLEK